MSPDVTEGLDVGCRTESIINVKPDKPRLQSQEGRRRRQNRGSLYSGPDYDYRPGVTRVPKVLYGMLNPSPTAKSTTVGREIYGKWRISFLLIPTT